MNDQDILATYINEFRKTIAPYLKSGVALKTEIYPSVAPGAVISVYPKHEGLNHDEMKPGAKSIAEILNNIPQNLISTPVPPGITIRGTNLVLDRDRILIVKGDDDLSEWGTEGAKRDIARILQSGEQS